MLTPGSNLPAYTISQLDQLQTPTTQLAGALLEFEIGIGGGNFKNVRGTTEELAQYLATLLESGGPGYTTLELAADRNLFTDELLPAIQEGLDDGTLVWIYDDGSGLRQQVAAGTSPAQAAAQNSAALISMANGLAKP